MSAPATQVLYLVATSVLGLSALLLVGISDCSHARAAAAVDMSVSDPAALRPTGVPLTEEERRWAQTAWSYFERNYQPLTGMVDAVESRPSTTLWQVGSYLMALLAAHDLGIIEPAQFTERASRLLDSLALLRLVDGKLPNRVYHTRSLRLLDERGRDAPGGVGWSASEIARLGVPFQLLIRSDPALAAKVRAVLASWRLDMAVAGRRLQDAERDSSGVLRRVKESRHACENYSARSLRLLNASLSVDSEPQSAACLLEAIELGRAPLDRADDEKMEWSYVFSGDEAHSVAELEEPGRGFYSDSPAAGARQALTAKTNSAILEALWYHTHGPLFATHR